MNKFAPGPALWTLLSITLAAPAAYSQAPVISAVSSGVGSATSTNIAPGGIILIAGTTLAQGAANLNGSMAGALPMSLGGVQVTVGGRMAPLFMVSPTMIVAQVPFEAAAGPQPVLVTSGTAASAAFNATVATTAPALFSDGSAGIVLKAADYSLVGAGNPAAPGQALLLYVTGLGQTAPASQTGVPAGSSTLANTVAPVSVRIGGQSANVLYAVAAPGFAGLYQVAVDTPMGVPGTVSVILQSGGASSVAISTVVGVVRAGQVDPQIEAVFTQYMALGPKPIQMLTPQEARQQPSFSDAVKALLQKQGKTTPEPVASTQDISVPGGAGPIPARVYTPSGSGPFPVILFFHGGGFVIATIDTYDASARALANAVGAIVIAVEYRKAPENRFPAAPEDAYAAVQWAFTNAGTYNGRTDRIAVDGESAGGNLAPWCA